jgi:PAS domain-containing protein
MARRASSVRDQGNGAGIWTPRGGDPQRVAPAAAGLHGDGGHNGAAADRVLKEPGEEPGRTEAALTFAASIVESSDDAIIGKTLDGMITIWNAGAERLYGYSAREVIGRWPIGITIPEDELRYSDRADREGPESARDA